MIIGDSLHSDIQGGPTSENSNCLAQSDLRSSNTNHSTQYTIQQLDELLPILGH